MTPFFMGVVVGAIVSGAVPATGGQASLQAWTSGTALLAGFVFVAACAANLAAVYLSGEAARVVIGDCSPTSRSACSGSRPRDRSPFARRGR